MDKIRKPSIEIDPNLSHLSDEELGQLQKDYLRGEESNKNLMQRFCITGFAYNALRRKIPPLIDTSMGCPECNAWAVRNIGSKGFAPSEPVCYECGQELVCPFDPERRARQLRLERNEAMLLNYMGREIEIPYQEATLSTEEFMKLSLEHRVFLGAIIANCIGEDMRLLKGDDISRRKLCPTTDYYNELVESLVELEVLPSANIWRTKFNVDEHLTERVLSTDYWFPFDTDEHFDLWKRMAYHEVVEYYNLRMTEIGLRTDIGKKGQSHIENLLNDLSVGQVLNLIYRSTKNVCEIIVKENVTRTHMANTVLYGCVNYWERCKANGWEIRPFTRSEKYYPQSDMSSFLYNKVLRIGDSGFNRHPNWELLALLTEEHRRKTSHTNLVVDAELDMLFFPP
ncbi:MAG: hypothetical protein RBT74_08455 [Tenuifilaceae bacterium]|jgi:hypothetical protein|nr:hypothetical protein [Tenuifilaceae bacterium]